jgi:putative redox protein
MKITINRVNDDVLFRVENANKATANVDGSPEIGGVDGGIRPMEMLLTAVATCSAFEIVNILKKQRQPLEDLSMNVSGIREKKGTAKPFSQIDVEFIVKGAVDIKKAKRAADLAINKYCSAKASLDPSIKVNYTVNIEA